jgi:predicted membrane chloride channel (bestrophin family)
MVLWCILLSCWSTSALLLLLPPPLLLLLQELAWWSLPVCMMISFLLFGIEEIGLQIEEPFGILALDVSGCWGQHLVEQHACLQL